MNIDKAKIAETVNRMHLPVGLGDYKNACSIAAINLALTGELTDDIPDCMSNVIGRWIIHIQDAMPDEMRNSVRWKSLLPRAAGTGRAHEKERLNLILDHMWNVVLPMLQPIADQYGFGNQWREMLTERTATTATTADAAWAAAAAAAASAEAAEAALAATSVAIVLDAWNRIDPCALLERLIEVSEQETER